MSEYEVPCPGVGCPIPQPHHHLRKPAAAVVPIYSPSRGDIVRIGQGALLWEVTYVGSFISLTAVDESGKWLEPMRNNSVKANRLTLVKAAPPPPPPKEFSKGAAAIWQERDRQQDQLGYTPEHDLTEHGTEEEVSVLLIAALTFVTTAFQRAGGLAVQPPAWPTAMGEFKSKSIDEDLVRAGALIAAELDRRAAASK